MRRAPFDGRSLRWPALLLIGIACTSVARADKVRITQLTDVDFGVVGAQTDTRRSQSVCVYANGQSGTYSVSASGSGAGGAFTLSNGPYVLGYDLEWNPLAGQTAGIPIVPNVALIGQTSAATNQQCSSGPSTSASLTLVLRGSGLNAARQGTYSGALTLILGAE